MGDADDIQFVGRFNNATGAVEWVVESDHDYGVELAASGKIHMHAHCCNSCCTAITPSYY
jgi:hypothetical protein